MITTSARESATHTAADATIRATHVPGRQRRRGRILTALVAAVAGVLLTSAPANALQTNELRIGVMAYCDSGYGTLTMVVSGVPTGYSGATPTQYWQYRLSVYDWTSRQWTTSPWYVRQGTNASIRSTVTLPSRYYTVQIEAAMWTGGRWVSVGSEYAYHQQRYMGGFASYLGNYCTT